MRIAVVTTSFPSYDGDPAGHFVEAEVAELARAGHEVRVVRPKPGGAFGWPGAPTRIRENPLRIFEVASWVVRARRELKEFRPERIVAHWCVPSALPIASGHDVEVEIVSHGGDVRLLCGMPRAVRTRIVQRLVREVTRWRFVSEELRLTLEASLDAEEARSLRAVSEIAPSSLDVPDVSEDARAARQAVGDRRLYVCAGRLVASKRVDKVIDYVASNGHVGISERDERVLVVLGDGPERAHLERLAKAWRIDVRFLGKTTRRETLGWISAADELVHASHVEGLSTVMREASILGVPVTILS
jgi:glycosyltransferase involved in cell wall biosynthesis